MSRPLVGESNKKQTVREVGCRTKFQNWIRRSQISYCYSMKVTLDYEKITLKEFSFEWSHFRISSTEFNDRIIFCSIINSTTGKYCSVAFI